MTLCRNGIPFDVAESWPDSERNAYFIICMEREGAGIYDFETGTFEKPTN